MKAWVLNNINDFKYTDMEMPKLNDDCVMVKVKAAGICGSDIARVYENGAHKMPLIIGHEFSGEVDEVGKDVDSKWLRKRVGVFPLIPCRRCPSCLNKKYEMCSNYSYLGSRTDGGFAEYVSVPEWNLIELPDSVSFEQAAMLEPMAVAVHAMRRLSLVKDASVAVCGLGTIGQLLTMFLLERGIKNIYTIGNKDSQKKSAMAMGIKEDNYCDMRVTEAETFLREKTNGNGVDFYFECVGKNETILQAINSIAPAGQICMVGNPYTDMSFDKNIYWKLLRKQLIITGTWNSSFFGINDESASDDDWHYVIKVLSRGNITPQNLITHRFKMSELNKGFEIMRDKSEEYMKIMMI